MSSLVQQHYIDNILSNGYLREFEDYNNIMIPDAVKHVIAMYCKHYKVYGIGCNDNIDDKSNPLICHPNNIFTNGYEINIKAISNELYFFGSIQLSVYTTSESDRILSTQKSLIDNPINTFTINPYENVIDIKCGLKHTLFLSNFGNVYSKGKNDCGQCGFDKKQFTNIETPKLMCQTIISIACGSFHNLLINDKYQLVVCGYNYSGQLGVNSEEIKDKKNEMQRYEIQESTTYIDRQSSDGINLNFGIDYVSDSDSSEDWSDWDNECILPVYTPMINKYFNELNIKIIKVYAGKFHSVCISNEGKVYTFGENSWGNLGNGFISEYGTRNSIPTEIKFDNYDYDLNIIDGSCGDYHNVLLSQTNDIIVFGNNSKNQCSKIINNDKICIPTIISKEKELGLSTSQATQCYIEKVVCTEDRSLIFIDEYKRMKMYFQGFVDFFLSNCYIVTTPNTLYDIPIYKSPLRRNGINIISVNYSTCVPKPKQILPKKSKLIVFGEKKDTQQYFDNIMPSKSSEFCYRLTQNYIAYIPVPQCLIGLTLAQVPQLSQNGINAISVNLLIQHPSKLCNTPFKPNDSLLCYFNSSIKKNQQLFKVFQQIKNHNHNNQK